MGEKNFAREIILKTVDVEKHFGELRAVDGVSLTIFQGEVLSIVGPNGAGKTTLLKLLSGGYPLDRGMISFMGKNISHLNLVERARMGIVYSFQIPALFENLTSMDNIRFPLFVGYHESVNFFRKIDRFGGIKKEAMEILKMFNVPENYPASQLPHGQRKLLDSAMAFSLKPKLLLLDEPTSGVSTKEKKKVMDIIMPNIQQSNATTVIVEHDMEIVVRYSDRVVVMVQGRILTHGAPDVVMRDQEVRRILFGEIAHLQKK